MAIDLIYCDAGNRRFAEIAIQAGFHYGARLPGRTPQFAPWFVDQDWKKPDRVRYMAALAKYRPVMATILDLESDKQLPEVLDWANEAAQFVSTLLVIPKAIAIIAKLPRQIGRAEIRLAYSVPTRYGGTYVPLWEFYGWPVHLLGGSPHAAMRLAHYLDVRSADGNMHNLMATKCIFWAPGTARYAKDRYWPSLKEENSGIPVKGTDLPYVAFARSCQNIVTAWRALEKSYV